MANTVLAWETVDWRLPNRVIADQLGTVPQTVASYRCKRGIQPRHVKAPVIPAELPWATHNDCQLERLCGVNRRTLAKWRKRLGLPASKRGGPCRG